MSGNKLFLLLHLILLWVAAYIGCLACAVLPLGLGLFFLGACLIDYWNE
jgi:hypothetical protein